jgi:precorrin-6A/cobalt-precorrin-6A reductase
LGGTSDANRTAARLASACIDAIYSYAGRTGKPLDQPLPTRIGGFGGVPGLTDYLQSESISHVIDATHPFAVEMSRNAVAACAALATPLIALQRAPWLPSPGDTWINVPDIDAAVKALPHEPARILLAIGKQHVAAFQTKPQHTYTLRLIDPPAGVLALAHYDAVIARGPFRLDDDVELMRARNITIVVTRNAGGTGARAKIDAARTLGVPVIMIARPAMPERLTVETVEECMDWLKHQACLGA